MPSNGTIHRAPFVWRPRPFMAALLTEELSRARAELSDGCYDTAVRRLEMAIVGTIADLEARDVEDWDSIVQDLLSEGRIGPNDTIG